MPESKQVLLRGNINHQVQRLFQTVNAIGFKKHDAKEVARADGARSWAEVGKKLGIHSYATADAYRDVWMYCADFAKENLGIRDIERLTGEAVGSFLQSKVDSGVAHATFMQYAAACEKLETALNRYAEQHKSGREYAFKEGMQSARAAAKTLARFRGSRAYADPDRIVADVRNDLHSLAASLQHEGGCRVKEASHITKDQLRGLRADEYTGRRKGYFEVRGKGGKFRDIGVSPATYERLEAAVTDKRFEFDKGKYRYDLKRSAHRSGQAYEGSHGLRWSFAQERHSELQQYGLTYEQSLSEISEEMGHDRADITTHYLR